MRKTISISMPDEMYRRLMHQCRRGSVSEYIRSLIRREEERRVDYASRPRNELTRMNDSITIAQALEQLETLKTILERRDDYRD